MNRELIGFVFITIIACGVWWETGVITGMVAWVLMLHMWLIMDGDVIEIMDDDFDVKDAQG